MNFLKSFNGGIFAWKYPTKKGGGEPKDIHIGDESNSLELILKTAKKILGVLSNKSKHISLSAKKTLNS